MTVLILALTIAITPFICLVILFLAFVVVVTPTTVAGILLVGALTGRIVVIAPGIVFFLGVFLLLVFFFVVGSLFVLIRLAGTALLCSVSRSPVLWLDELKTFFALFLGFTQLVTYDVPRLGVIVSLPL